MSEEAIQFSDSLEADKFIDTELVIGSWLDSPYVQLAIGIIVVLMLLFLALKAGFSLWLLNKIGYGERLVNARGEPDFWSVSKTLDAYQRPTGDPKRTVKQEVASVAPGKKEHLTDPKVLAALL
jgi:hypothetical protein